MFHVRMYAAFFLMWTAFFAYNPTARASLDPGEILVIANKKASSNVGVARCYMRERGIPEENLIQLWVTNGKRSAGGIASEG